MLPANARINEMAGALRLMAADASGYPGLFVAFKKYHLAEARRLLVCVFAGVEFLAAIKGRQGREVFRLQRGDHGRHDVALAASGLKVTQLLDDIALLQAGDLGEHRNGAVAIFAMAGNADGGGDGLGILRGTRGGKRPPQYQGCGNSKRATSRRGLVVFVSMNHFQLLRQGRRRLQLVLNEYANDIGMVVLRAGVEQQGAAVVSADGTGNDAVVMPVLDLANLEAVEQANRQLLVDRDEQVEVQGLLNEGHVGQRAAGNQSGGGLVRGNATKSRAAIVVADSGRAV